MKPLLILISILFGFLSMQAQYDYPYDSGNHYYDNTPRLIIQKSRIMGWYVSDINGNALATITNKSDLIGKVGQQH